LFKLRVQAGQKSYTQARLEAKTFTGTVPKSGENYGLSDSATKSRYIFDDHEKVRRCEGKHVKITGAVDAASNTIHVETIEQIV